MDAALAEHVIEKIPNASERRIARLLCDAGLELVATNSRFYSPGHVPTAEVDLVFASKETTWVVEVSTNVQRQAQRKKRQRLGAWAADARIAELAAKHELPRRNRVRLVYFDLSAKPEGVGFRGVMKEKGVITLYREHVLQLEKAVRRARAATADTLADLVGDGDPET